MIDWSDPNIPYMLMGLLAFWGPVLGYAGWLRARAGHLEEETALLHEEMGEG